MSQNALLINYDYCTGCRSCELACRNALGLGLSAWGIKVAEVEPFEYEKKKWDWVYQPVPTKLCNLCKDRVAVGQSPACVHHCLAACMEFGTLEDMAKRAAEIGTRVSIFIP
jgi:Fe-S-cluster-containing dehydrogenase component